ncbi:MAG TPA: two-component regulator propeller domain-containing protein [Cyclobacteriaceae bacterium]
MSGFRGRFFGFVFLMTVFLTAQGQQDQYSFAQLDVNRGLSNNAIRCFLKDRQGFIWIGTFSGLNRFDGYSIKAFTNSIHDTTSLVDNDIEKLFEDPFGKLWVNTWNGQCIYDPETETFTRNSTPVLKQFNIPAGRLTTIVKSTDNEFWFAHNTEGLYRYNVSAKRMVVIRHSASDSTSIATNEVASLQPDKNGYIWLVHKNGIIEKVDTKTNKVVYRNRELFNLYHGALMLYYLMIDTDGDIWIYVEKSNKGLFFFNHVTRRLDHYTTRSGEVHINTELVRGIVEDDNKQMWVAMDHGGINIIDKRNKTVKFLFNNPDDSRSICQNSFNAIYRDQDGFIWTGTVKNGVSYYHENAIRFPLINHQPSNPKTMPYSDINCFEEDKNGNLWLGTNGGGLIYYDRTNQSFKSYKSIPGDNQSLSSNVIISLCIDHANRLWVGTYYGGLNLFDGKKFIRYKHDPDNSKSISDDNIWELFEDSQQRLWIGTMEHGIDLIDVKSGTFTHINGNDRNPWVPSYIPVIKEDEAGNIWLGTYYGIYIIQKDGVCRRYLSDPNTPGSLSQNGVVSMCIDAYGMIWIGTKDGLNLFDPSTKTFKVFRVEDGIPHNSIINMLGDNAGNLWISTPKGITNMRFTRDASHRIKNVSFQNFDESDGLQGRQFNEGAAFVTREGEMLFGGANGFNIFKPDKIVLNRVKPKVILSDFQIFNNSIKIGEEVGGTQVLTNSISLTKEVTLNHNQNIFSIEFAALTFFHSEKNQYKYMLEGFNKNWLTTNGNSRRVTYTNLDAGEYTFHVKASNSDGVWTDKDLKLKIIVLPPFWKTKAAFFFYILIVLGVLLISRQMILQRERLKYKIEKERQEANQLHELDMMKIKFFTNVSHEFRTPLSLILTPIEKILKNTSDPEQKNQFQMIHRNARRLLNLVNQLLDLRKMEVQEVKLNASEGDIVAFIKETSYSFSDLSEKKSISFSVTSTIPSLETLFDKDKLEKILFNLLSNAFKFTPEHGSVEVEINQVTKTNDDRSWLEIKVKDTGIGIPLEKQDKIFERFFQHDLPKSMVNQGSGIGLSITYEFVKAHEGTITVQSEPDKGSCFTVSIPVPELLTKREAEPVVDESVLEPVELEASSENDSIPTNTKLSRLLLVEDNEDFRFYLKDNLKLHYEILEARNGKEGFEKTKQYLPDLIVSDVMMPEMNGIELCRKVKNERTISHIPVILLTARTSEEQKLEGLETGADDYITKPFNFEILQSRIKYLIHQRESFHQDFRKQIEVKASTINITSLDEKLIQNAIKLVEDNIAEPDFSVEHLSRELGMSRVHLYKKLLSLTGKAPLEFIRIIRLQRASQLLEKSQLTVAEVAYKVGFNNPKYFTKYFKEEFNMLPSAYAASKRNEKS